MKRVYPSLLLAALCLSYVSGKCEENIVKKIKELNNGIDDSSILNVSGDYDTVYVSGSSSVPAGFSNSTCQVANFYKDNDGNSRFGHNGVLAGAYILKYQDGKVLVVDPKTGKVLRNTYIVYRSTKYAVTGFYACDVSGPAISIGSISVAAPELKSRYTETRVAEAKAALTKVGLSFGAPITACYKK